MNINKEKHQNEFLMDNIWNENEKKLNLMNEIWNNKNNNLNTTMSNLWDISKKTNLNDDKFSTEYLKKFDQKIQTKNNNEWINEFLEKINSPFVNETKNLMETNNFSKNDELFNYVFNQVI